MYAKTILKNIQAGKTVEYKIRRLRGYLWGYTSLFFKPEDAHIGVNNIEYLLTNFRRDEMPYDKPVWIVHHDSLAITEK